MFDAIFIGTSGLHTYSDGLKVISNNIANLNTPGFKASNSMFANLYYAHPGDGGGLNGRDSTHYGSGVELSRTTVNFRTGELRQTGNPLDLNINGDGFFISSDKSTGEQHYSRAGQFEFNKDGKLVIRGTDRQVVGLDTGGAQTPISLNGWTPSPTATGSRPATRMTPSVASAPKSAPPTSALWPAPLDTNTTALANSSARSRLTAQRKRAPPATPTTAWADWPARSTPAA